MSKIRYYGWRELEELGKQRIPALRAYGVPRGGAFVVALLRHVRKVDRPEDAEVIVDDILDSGRTAKVWRERFPKIPFVALIDKEKDCPDQWAQFPWEPPYQTEAEDLVVRTLQMIGENPAREGLLKTPARVVASWKRLFGGYGQEAKDVLGTTFGSDGYDQMVCLRNVEFYSTCEHHLLPFAGQAHIAYIPKDRVVGISKLARLVEVFARRLQIQERLTQQIADAIQAVLDPKGVGVLLEAKHFCMVCRGVEKQHSVMVTSALRGAMLAEGPCRDEFLRVAVGK